MIAAVEPCSFVDYPGRVATVAFTQGCNLRCRYCHNPRLCKRKAVDPSTTERWLELLRARRGLLSGVVLSGGEPTLWRGLGELLRRVRAMGFAIKLDSNGSCPSRIDELMGEGLLDYLAVDVKAVPGAASAWLCGAPEQGRLALQTLSQAVRAGLACEARTVLLAGIHDEGALAWLARRLAEHGVRRWRLQSVRAGRLLDGEAKLVPPPVGVVEGAVAAAMELGLTVQWAA